MNRPTSALRPSERRFLEAARVGHLATVSEAGEPQVIPICFVLIGDVVYSPLDQKPKHVDPSQLRRVRNILAHPTGALVVDEYAEDWERLAYVLLRGVASVLPASGPEHAEAVRRLREKYPQYRSMVIDERPTIRLTIERARSWSARGDRFVDEPGSA